MKNKKLEVIIFSAIIIGIISLSIGSFYVYRWFNYKFGYKQMVIETICENVEHLKDPTICNK